MNRKLFMAVISVPLVAALGGGVALARGGFGGFHGGGGFGGFHGGGYGGYRGGYGGGMHYGGMSSMSRTPSMSSYRGSGYGYGSRGSAEGMRGGQLDYGTRSGSYTTARGGTVDYGAAGAAGRGAYGGEAGRGVYGVSGTTAGGRSYGDVGRVGGAVGPGGNAVAGRSNIGGVSGPNGTAVAGSRGFAASGYGGAYAGRSYGAAGAYRTNGFNAYGGYHQGWVHGYWNGHDSAAWGWHNPYWGGAGAWGMGLGMGVGMGLGWGLSSWGFGSSLYGMGYMPYSNPYYYGANAGMAMPYDYAQPIDTVSAPAAESVTDPAMALFDAGRASFKEGNYADALRKTDDALGKLPNDTTLHEFRALCLFAMDRYDEAAATLYAVLAVGPGWDWTTLISLYPGVDVYTAQLRALEAYTRAHSDSATSRFVLAYHYLTEGFTDAAVPILRQVVALKPNDTLSTKLLRQLDPPKDQPATVASPSPAPTDTTPPQGASIAGTWNAEPTAGTSIALVIQPAGAFSWQATVRGQKQQLTGTSTYGDGILTLAQDKGPALVGRVSWKDASHMTFRVVGDGPDDPGLSFAK
jgi:tetratricopeptide (TPR) repeat protein